MAKDIKAEILFRAEKLAHYNDLLIRQCDSWLSEEEGYQNMMREYMTRKTSKIQRFKDSKIQRFKNSKIVMFCNNLKKTVTLFPLPFGEGRGGVSNS